MAQRQLNSPKGKATPSRTPTSEPALNLDVSDSERRNFSDEANNGHNSSPNKGNNTSPIQGTKTPNEGNRVERSDFSDGEVRDSQSDFEKAPRNWQTERSGLGTSGQNKRKHVEISGSSSSSSSSSSSDDDSSSDSDNLFDPDNSIISKGETIPRKISKYISKYANQGISKDTRLSVTKNCKVPNHKGLKPKETDRFMKKLFRRKFFNPLSDKKERAIINTQSRILDATGPLAILWNEAEKLKKKRRGVDPRDVIDIVQRSLVLIGNAHYVYLTDRRRSILGKILPDCLDLLSDSRGKKALLKSKSDLFGNRFRKLLTEESKDNRELNQLLPFPSNRRSKRGNKRNKSNRSSFSHFSQPADDTSQNSQFFQSGPSTSQQSQLWGQFSCGASHSNRGLSRGRGQKQTRK